MPQLPATVRVALVATIIAWLLLELSRVRHVRPEARQADRGSVFVVRLAAVAGYAGALTVGRAVPAAAIHPASAAAWGGLVVLWCGIVLRAWCFRTLGTYFTFTVQTSADQPVITTGPYRLLRHPSYTALLLTLAGLATVVIANWLSLLVLVIAFAGGLVYRINVEERALLRDLGEAYRGYAATRKRLVPFVW
jgi:protein-S-isoprenylcysteine O-methyltransferase Ste14